MRGWFDDTYNENCEEGRILEYITIKREDGNPEEIIKENIIVRFHLTEESAEKYLQAKWKRMTKILIEKSDIQYGF